MAALSLWMSATHFYDIRWNLDSRMPRLHPPEHYPVTAGNKAFSGKSKAAFESL